MPSPKVRLRDDEFGSLNAAALRKTLADHKHTLKNKATWAKLAGLPIGIVTAAFRGAKIPDGTLEALAAVVGIDADEMLRSVIQDISADAPAIDADSFGRRLRSITLRLGLSDSEVARRLDISPTRYGHYTRGRSEPSLAMLRALCDALNLTPNDLLGYSGTGA